MFSLIQQTKLFVNHSFKGISSMRHYLKKQAIIEIVLIIGLIVSAVFMESRNPNSIIEGTLGMVVCVSLILWRIYMGIRHLIAFVQKEFNLGKQKVSEKFNEVMHHGQQDANANVNSNAVKESAMTNEEVMNQQEQNLKNGMVTEV
jgi:hypothetical protein